MTSRRITLLTLYMAVLQPLCPIQATFNLTGVEKFIVTRRESNSDIFRTIYETVNCPVCGSTAYREDSNLCSCACDAQQGTFLPELGECGDTATVKRTLFGSCSLPLGMENGMISDAQLTSYTHRNNAAPEQGRLNKKKAWCSYNNSIGFEYFQVDLLEVRLVSAIATQGVKGGSINSYVREFLIKYSYDGVKWLFYNDQSGHRQTFYGNQDANSIKNNTFRATFETRFLRIFPVVYSHEMCLRVELYGCSNQAVCSRFFEWPLIFLQSLNLEAKGFPTFNSNGQYDSCHVVPGNTSYYSYDVQIKWVDVCNDIFKIGSNEHNQDVLEWRADESKKLLGRIIRVMITCNYTTSRPPKTGCLAFKASGQITYNLDSVMNTPTSCPATSSTVDPQLGSSSLLVVPSSASSTTSSISVTLVTSSASSKASLASSVPLSSTPASGLVASSSLSVSKVFSASFLPSRSLPPLFSLQSSTTETSVLLYPFSSFLTSQPPQTKFVSSSEMVLPPRATSKTHTALPTKSAMSTDKQETVTSVKPSKSSSATKMTSSSAAPPVGPGNKEARTKGNINGTIIGAAVGGAVVLGIVFIVIAVVCKRRRLWENKEKPTKLQVKNPVYGSSDIPLNATTDNQVTTSSDQDSQPTYQGPIINNGQKKGSALYSNPDDNYDNCTVYQSLDKKKPGAPVYESLKKGQVATGKPNLSRTGRPSERPKVSAEPVYNVLEQPDAEQGAMPERVYGDPGRGNHGDTQDPLYNVLEGPDVEQTYTAPDVGDPLYNVLEGPESTQGPQEPLYNVLESSDAENSPSKTQGPYDGADSEPLYNVLEEPDSDGPNKDGGGCPAPIGSTSPDGHDNPAYEQTLELNAPYASVHKPGSQRESVYEPLRGPERQDLYMPISKGRTAHT